MEPNPPKAPETGIERRLEQLAALMRRMVKTIHLIEEPANLTPTQWLVLVHLEESPRMRIGVLAQALGAAQNTVSEVVTRLERAGMLVKERDPDDNRAVKVRLTDKAKAALHGRRQNIRAANRALLQAMDDTEQQRFVEAFELMVSMAERARAAMLASQENRRNR
jgi:DNA-binding MarR family transcriptional regulator